jgi:hypothetical protein
MAIPLILVVYCFLLGPIYAIMVQCCRFSLNLHVRVTLNVFRQFGLLVLARSFVLEAVSVKSDPRGPTSLSSVKFDPPLDRLNTNDLVGGVGLRLY